MSGCICALHVLGHARGAGQFLQLKNLEDLCQRHEVPGVVIWLCSLDAWGSSLRTLAECLGLLHGLAEVIGDVFSEWDKTRSFASLHPSVAQLNVFHVREESVVSNCNLPCAQGVRGVQERFLVCFMRCAIVRGQSCNWSEMAFIGLYIVAQEDACSLSFQRGWLHR